MLLSEMVRQISKEQQLYLDQTYYDSPVLHDWATRKTKTITLSEASIVFIRFKGRGLGSNPTGSMRLLHNSDPVLVYPLLPTGVTSEQSLFMWLAAGDHTFDLQTAVAHSPNNNEKVRIEEFYIATVGFPDVNGTKYAPSPTSVGAGATVTVATLNLTAPATRKLAVGNIKQYALITTVYACMVDNRPNTMKNPADTNEASKMNFRFFLDDVEVGWKERQDDYAGGGTASYAEGAHGRYYVAVDAGTSHTLKVKAYNGFSSAYTAKVVLCTILCPWFLIDRHQPLSLNFPQGSTLYVTAEPLHTNPTKTLKLGWQRFVSFGDTTDYYSTGSGTDILSWNYTFESVEVSNCVLLVSGYGGCLSIIGVDVR